MTGVQHRYGCTQQMPLEVTRITRPNAVIVRSYCGECHRAAITHQPDKVPAGRTP